MYLREPYEKRFYWWEIAILARRTVRVALIVFLATSRRAQLLAVILATFAALLVHRELGAVVSANYMELAVLSVHVALATVLGVLEQPYSDATVVVPLLGVEGVAAAKPRGARVGGGAGPRWTPRQAQPEGRCARAPASRARCTVDSSEIR